MASFASQGRMSDDDLSQRERRMQRHKETVRKDLPKTVAKTYGVWLLVILVVAGTGYALYKASTGGQECPTHWHATFEVYVPGANGKPELIDMASPRAANGGHFYDLNGGAGWGLSVHMHQTGSEAGSDPRLYPTQLHYEPQDGSCVGVKSTLHAMEIDADASSLKLFGAHAQVHQDKTWTVNATDSLHYYLDSKVGGNWTWGEQSWSDLKGHQLRDGESLLVLFGNYTPDQVKQLQAGVPAPMTRV